MVSERKQIIETEHEDSGTERTGYEAFRTSLRKSSVEKAGRRQHKKNYLDKFENWVGLATFFVVLAYTVITYRLWTSQQTANQINARNLVASNRPWLEIQKPQIQGIPNHDDKGLEILISSFIKNFGKEPAIDTVISIHLYVVPLGVGLSESIHLQETACAKLKSQKDEYGSTVMPDQRESRLNIIDIPEKDISAIKPPANFFLAGCIDYRFPYDIEHHQSSYAYILSYPRTPSADQEDIVPESEGPPVRAPNRAMTEGALIDLTTLVNQSDKIGFSPLPFGWKAY